MESMVRHAGKWDQLPCLQDRKGWDYICDNREKKSPVYAITYKLPKNREKKQGEQDEEFAPRTDRGTKG